MARKDFIGSVADIAHRVRDLETGATPTVVDQGGYGRNTSWRVMAIRAPAVMEPGSVLRRRCRADQCWLQTVGDGINIDAVTEWPFFLAAIGESGRPNQSHTLLAAQMGGYASVRVDARGHVRIEYEPTGTGPLRLSGAFAIG